MRLAVGAVDPPVIDEHLFLGFSFWTLALVMRESKAF
jgi:hypothetical protein